MMNILDKINKLRLERGWSINKLALEACLTQSTVQNMFWRKNSLPSLSTLTAICKAFNIDLCEFFNDQPDKMIPTEEEMEFLKYFRLLSKPCRKSLTELTKSIVEKNSNK